MEEFTQRDLVAYILYSYKEINKYNEKTINNYIEKLQNHLLNTKIGQVLFVVDLRLFNDFWFRAKLNSSETIAYSKLIYHGLLSRIDKSFTDEDIIKKCKEIFYSFSGRTAIEEVIKLGL